MLLRRAGLQGRERSTLAAWAKHLEEAADHGGEYVRDDYGNDWHLAPDLFAAFEILSAILTE
jgi:hypothetical protein